MTDIEPDFVQLEDNFNRAMVSNDIAQIADCISDDWVLVTPQSGAVSRETILGIIESGVLRTPRRAEY